MSVKNAVEAKFSFPQFLIRSEKHEEKINVNSFFFCAALVCGVTIIPSQRLCVLLAKIFAPLQNNYKHQQKKLVHFSSSEKVLRASWLTYLGQENCVNGFSFSAKVKGKEKKFFLVFFFSFYCEQRRENERRNYKGKLMVKWGKIDVKANGLFLREIFSIFPARFRRQKKAKNAFSRFTKVNIFLRWPLPYVNLAIFNLKSHFTRRIFLERNFPPYHFAFLCRPEWIFMRSVSYMKCLNLCRGWKKLFKSTLSWKLNVWEANGGRKIKKLKFHEKKVWKFRCILNLITALLEMRRCHEITHKISSLFLVTLLASPWENPWKKFSEIRR